MNRINKKALYLFIAAFGVAIACMLTCVIKTNAFNRLERQELFSDDALFSANDEQKKGVSVNAVPRNNTWTKDFRGKTESRMR